MKPVFGLKNSQETTTGIQELTITTTANNNGEKNKPFPYNSPRQLCSREQITKQYVPWISRMLGQKIS